MSQHGSWKETEDGLKILTADLMEDESDLALNSTQDNRKVKVKRGRQANEVTRGEMNPKVANSEYMMRRRGDLERGKGFIERITADYGARSRSNNNSFDLFRKGSKDGDLDYLLG